MCRTKKKLGGGYFSKIGGKKIILYVLWCSNISRLRYIGFKFHIAFGMPPPPVLSSFREELPRSISTSTQ